MNWKHAYITLLCLVSVIYIQAQNLVPNGGFEKHISFEAHGVRHYTTGRVVLNWKDFNGRTAAYCHKDLVKRYGYDDYKWQSFWQFDTAQVFDGKAMVKFWYGESCPEKDTGCTGYLKTKLISPLELGEVYEVSMWVYVVPNPANDTATYSRIGMYLTRHAVPYYTLEDLLPVHYFFSGKPVPGTWSQIKWHIRALCTLEHLTIGMFRDSTFKSLYRGIDNPHYFFIDNVSIVKVEEDSIAYTVVATPYCEYFERQLKQHLLQTVTAADVYFPSNQFELDENDKAVIDSFYLANKESKNEVYIVIGHTDDQLAENAMLSERRAQSVKQHLVEAHGLPAKRILTFGLASAKPKATNATTSGRTLNRRATIRTSHITIPQLMYREGLAAVDADSLAKASVAFARWIRLAPKGKHAEMLIDPRIQKLKRCAYWRDLVIEVRKGYARYKDSKSAFYLDSLYFEDQRYRTPDFHDLSGIIEEIDTMVLPVFTFTEKQALQKDSINLLAAQRFFEKNGYPTIAQVGRRPARGFGYVILHSGDREVYEKYIPILEQVCRNGEGEWDIYAMMCDKLSVQKNEPQKYGTQYRLTENKQLELYEVDNIESVNARRIRYGLTPISNPE